MGTSSISMTGRDFVGGRPRGFFTATTRPISSNSPPQTPHGSSRSRAPWRQSRADVHLAQMALARWMSTYSSEKKRYDNVPLPSLQRRADRRAGSSRRVTPPISLLIAVYMVSSFSLVVVETDFGQQKSRPVRGTRRPLWLVWSLSLHLSLREVPGSALIRMLRCHWLGKPHGIRRGRKGHGIGKGARSNDHGATRGPEGCCSGVRTHESSTQPQVQGVWQAVFPQGRQTLMG